MTIQSYIEDGNVGQFEHNTIAPLCESLRNQLEPLQRVPVADLLDLFDAFSRQILADPDTRQLEGISFLATWLRRSNLEALLALNLNGEPGFLDSFRQLGDRRFVKAQPAGVVCQWLAGNVPTLVFFSLIPSLLAKNPTLVKLHSPEPPATMALFRVLAQTSTERFSGPDLLRAVRAIYFDYTISEYNEQMSLNADCKVMWGGEAAIKGITSLPRHEHCSEIVFGPKYSIGMVSRASVQDPARLQRCAQGIVRDVVVFDQRACSSPQTLFVEGDQGDARKLAEALATEFAKAPAKAEIDAFTAVQIMNARARYGLGEHTDLFQSARGNDWTVCVDPEVSLKTAIQSRTLFVVPVSSWREITPLLSPKIQSVGVDFVDQEEALKFSAAATLVGAARCVRFGLMNLYESPWDGKLMVNQLVRWVTAKP